MLAQPQTAGSLVWTNQEGENIAVASFTLAPATADGKRELRLGRPELPRQVLTLGPLKSGCFERVQAYCGCCDRRPYKLYAAGGRGFFRCVRCAQLSYASRYVSREVRECERNPAAFLARRGRIRGVYSAIVTMRTLEQARPRIVNKAKRRSASA